MAYWPSSAWTMSLPGGCWLVRKTPIFMPISGSAGTERAEAVDRQCRRRVATPRCRAVARRIGGRLARAHGAVALLVAHINGELRLGIGHGAIIGAEWDFAIIEPHQGDVLALPVVQHGYRLAGAGIDHRTP